MKKCLLALTVAGAMAAPMLNISSKHPNQLNGLVLARADLLLKWQSQLKAQEIALEQILKDAGLQHAD